MNSLLALVALLLSVNSCWAKKGGCQKLPPPVEGGIRYPGMIPDLVRDLTTLPHFYEIEYVCRPSRELVGPRVRRCQTNGTWTDVAQPTKCLERCGESELSLKHGHVLLRGPESKAVAGAIVAYSCQEGYRLQGSPTNHCTKRGVWNSTAPRCQRDGAESNGAVAHTSKNHEKKKRAAR